MAELDDVKQKEVKGNGRYPFLVLAGLAILGIAIALLIFGGNLFGDGEDGGVETAVLPQIPDLNTVSGIPTLPTGDGLLQVGSTAYDFQLQDLEGNAIALNDFQGQPVILNFWATWCAPCRAEFPEFQQAAIDNADTLTIIGINNTTTDQAHLIPGFLEEFGVTFPIVLDESGETSKAYRILGLPTTIFIDSDGIVNEIFTGPLNKAYIESKISELEAGL